MSSEQSSALGRRMQAAANKQTRPSPVVQNANQSHLIINNSSQETFGRRSVVNPPRTPTPEDPPPDYGDKAGDEEMDKYNRLLCNTRGIVLFVHQDVGFLLVPDNVPSCHTQFRRNLSPRVTVFFNRHTFIDGQRLNFSGGSLNDVLSPGDHVDCTIDGDGPMADGMAIGLRFCTGLNRDKDNQASEASKVEMGLILKPRDGVVATVVTASECEKLQAMILPHCFPRDDLIAALAGAHFTTPESPSLEELTQLNRVAELPQLGMDIVGRTVSMSSVVFPRWGEHQFLSNFNRLAISGRLEQTFEGCGVIHQYIQPRDNGQFAGGVLKDMETEALVYFPVQILELALGGPGARLLPVGSTLLFEACPELPRRQYNYRAFKLINFNDQGEPVMNEGKGVEQVYKSDDEISSGSVSDDESSEPEVSPLPINPVPKYVPPKPQVPPIHVSVGDDLADILNPPEAVGSEVLSREETPVKELNQTVDSLLIDLGEEEKKVEPIQDLLTADLPPIPCAAQSIMSESGINNFSSTPTAQGPSGSLFDLDFSSLASSKFFDGLAAKSASMMSIGDSLMHAAKSRQDGPKEESDSQSQEFSNLEHFLSGELSQPTQPANLNASIDLNSSQEENKSVDTNWFDGSVADAFFTGKATVPPAKPKLEPMQPSTSAAPATVVKKETEVKKEPKTTAVCSPSGSGQLLMVTKAEAEQLSKQPLAQPKVAPLPKLEPKVIPQVPKAQPVIKAEPVAPKIEPTQSVKPKPPPMQMQQTTNTVIPLKPPDLSTQTDMSGARFLDELQSLGASDLELDAIEDLRELTPEIYELMFNS